MSNRYKYIIESVLALGLGSAAVGAAIGALGTKGISSYRNRHLTCKTIEDPYRRDMCIIKILDSMIENLQALRNSCDAVHDPAQCKLDLAYKIDKLIQKKYRIQQSANRKNRARMIDRELS